MAWAMLVVAGLFEAGWAFTMKQSEGWTRLRPSLLTIGLMIVSFYLLSRAMKDLPAGTAYAVWTGIGTVGVVALGVAFLKEPVTPARLLFIGLIVAGIVGLKVTNGK
ncbi:MAG TPA: multidrug efflux SMR transporter [Phycisphaerales bacterium]|nr:multidrug efflux SMR transporter [Phycisphaerales bacterium]